MLPKPQNIISHYVTVTVPQSQNVMLQDLVHGFFVFVFVISESSRNCAAFRTEDWNALFPLQHIRHTLEFWGISSRQKDYSEKHAQSSDS